MAVRKDDDQRSDRLTEEQCSELCSPLGFQFAGDLPGSESAFDSAEDRRRAWEQHEEQVRDYMKRMLDQGFTTGKLAEDGSAHHPFAYYVYSDDAEPDRSDWQGQLPEDRWEDC